ncbi:MAG: UDP-N-acetylmuramoylalanine--D-glutamate ligase [Candidatus Fluviicola riflensis]|nr:MAG: UDP-N-acetylmuramoyl-L-alanine--D-glutamate ligase [Candidatus Fluviicola riflensis]OGS76715.1 MAG: UDP-N-acetylmuramoylalanine--D-glutamate ligase [Candidatus Fluviicola riflensis]OGS82930.1 MAG: UDP-N-acetylmuramoylalanine--D-glutamate ligase [Fluviicola sp. RIFCSPHIGHO2_01_FULL_43_53]OGS88445.1 MAG: UDP-N-acetylmuramoylalanine--D-glutamate ligase [Fluviicola sp. RIFCSPHIGHO2_12_FULL_43_24]
MDLNTKIVVILGAGESGVGAAILAQAKGAKVFVSDYGTVKPSFQQELGEYGLEWEQGTHSMERILEADLIVKSPGIPEKTPVMKAIREKGIKVVSEIELAGYFTTAKKVCITGSNGKTTTTMMIHHLLTKAGMNVGLAGNVGYSFAKQVALENKEIYVLELSSFQLDDMEDFRADIAILTNITPDHLDRYEYNMQLYVDSKFRILQNQTAEDYFIYNADDPIINAELEKRSIASQLLPFSLTKTFEKGAYIANKQLIINFNNQFIMSIHDLALKGKHNTQNSLASGLAGRLLDIRKDVVRESLSDFVNVEHRLEFVAKVCGIEFINDSKATNVNSTWFALESMENPTVWIVGGVDKGNDYSELTELVKEKVKAIICLGKDNQKIIDAFSGMVETIVEAGSAMEAVAYGYRLAKKDETVLLSPCCASFDLFENYEDRGNQFKQAVRSL